MYQNHYNIGFNLIAPVLPVASKVPIPAALSLRCERDLVNKYGLQIAGVDGANLNQAIKTR